MGKKGRGQQASRPKAKQGGRLAPRRNGKSKPYQEEDLNDLIQELKPLGLAVRKMEADGNCLFRAVGDQLFGNCDEHLRLREECCAHMVENSDEFELFYADDDPESAGNSFDTYVGKMTNAGCWGSQLELMALCQKYGINAIVHQTGAPSYEMVAAPLEAPCIQVSYHDGEHYNSVRFSWDMKPAVPARCLTLRQLRGEDPEVDSAVEQVREGLPPELALEDAAIRAALHRAQGDVDAAVELLLEDSVGLGTSGHEDPEKASDRSEEQLLTAEATKLLSAQLLKV